MDKYIVRQYMEGHQGQLMALFSLDQEADTAEDAVALLEAVKPVIDGPKWICRVDVLAVTVAAHYERRDGQAPSQDIHDVGPDMTVEDHGSICLVRPHTGAAKGWLDEHITGDTAWFGNALSVEHRYLEDLVAAMDEAGLRIEI